MTSIPSECLLLISSEAEEFVLHDEEQTFRVRISYEAFHQQIFNVSLLRYIDIEPMFPEMFN